MVEEKILFDDEEPPAQGLNISPTDIIQREFSVRFRGYDTGQVDDFLEEVAKAYNQLIEERARVSEESRVLRQKLAASLNKEKDLYDALAAAQKLSSDMQDNARKEASLIVAGAQLDADKIIADVRQQCAALQQEINSMVQKRAQFEASLRTLLESYLGMLGGERNNIK